MGCEGSEDRRSGVEARKGEGEEGRGTRLDPALAEKGKVVYHAHEGGVRGAVVGRGSQ
jgi:hypothetical protein